MSNPPLIVVETLEGALERLLRKRLGETGFARIRNAFDRGEIITIQVVSGPRKQWKYMVSFVKRQED